jgi:hypothetical protein
MNRLTLIAIGAAVGAGGLYFYVQSLLSAALAIQPKGNPGDPSNAAAAAQYTGYLAQLATFGVTSLPSIATMQAAYNVAQQGH